VKLGDLVNVVQTIGCHHPPRVKERGMGIILKVVKTSPVDIGTAIDVYLGDDIMVSLSDGNIETFNEKSVEVISESR
jgi:hypothetical protein